MALRRSWGLAGVILISVASVGIVAGLYVANRSGAGEGRVEVPDLSGLTVAQARTVLDRSELRLGLVGQRGPDSGSLLVAEQTPSAGSEVAEQATVDIVVSPRGDPSASNVTNWRFELPSREEILEILAQFGFAEVALLDIALPPQQLLVWEAVGHFHARTDYGRGGHGISLLQADEESVGGSGEFVNFRRAELALRRDDGTICWLERGYGLCLTPGDRSYGPSLEWVEP